MSSFCKFLKSKHTPSEEEKAKIRNISCSEAEKLYQTAKDDYTWLDVRTQAEYDEGHIPGCKLIPIDELEDRPYEAGPKEKQYIVFCRSGGRSTAACVILYEKGYRNLFNMQDGMSKWKGPTKV